MNEYDIRNKLYERMQQEYNDYLNSLMEASPKEIIDNSYQIVVKDEMVSMFIPESERYDIEDIKVLSKTKKPLEELYQDWLNCDVNINQILDDSIQLSFDNIKEAQKNKNKSHER